MSRYVFSALLLAFLTSTLSFTVYKAVASDHDDGERDLKGRSLNLTDFFFFREDNQTDNPADAENLILIMNSNPRSLPGQQYFFSTQAAYDFHITRVLAQDKAKKPTGRDDVILRFQFSPPDANNLQSMTVTLIRDGAVEQKTTTASGGKILTTNINESKNNQLRNNAVSFGGRDITVFAGLREDPFFFDVEQFFKLRAVAAATNGRDNIGFLPPAEAKDFAHNYNVNTIVVRVPMVLLQNSPQETVFDGWITISVPI